MSADLEELYTSLGYLFYSIAASDGKVAPAERERLMKEVDLHWVPLESTRDAVGMDAAHYIDISFDYANDNAMTPDEAYARFLTHYRDHPEHFDPSTKNLIYTTAAAIANAVAGRNKSELVRLSQLHVAFQG